jgi:hypothetical protein
MRVYFMLYPRRAFAWIDRARESPSFNFAVDCWFGVSDTLGSEIIPTKESYRLLPVHFDSIHLIPHCLTIEAQG